MKTKSLAVLLMLFLLTACSSDSVEVELTDPGFGFTWKQISAEPAGFDVPIHLKYPEPMKGIQFTLVWDPSEGMVGEPVLREPNQSFSLSVNKKTPGRMKVLIYSMTSETFDLSSSHIMDLPVSILSREVQQFKLMFEDAIFAGPQAAAYTLPISHGQFEVLR